MIHATKSHDVESGDAALLVDIDLGILGAAPSVFENYDQAIRLEYGWVPETHYRLGRAQILRTFLDRDVIFKTPRIRDQLEEQARENLARKLHELAV